MRLLTEPGCVENKRKGFKLQPKGSEDLAGGRRLHVIVAIACGKGIILKLQYKKLTGEFFCNIYSRTFQPFAKAGPKADG